MGKQMGKNGITVVQKTALMHASAHLDPVGDGVDDDALRDAEDEILPGLAGGGGLDRIEAIAHHLQLALPAAEECDGLGVRPDARVNELVLALEGGHVGDDCLVVGHDHLEDHDRAEQVAPQHTRVLPPARQQQRGG